MAASFNSSSKNVTTAATAEQVTTTLTSVTDIVIKAKALNTGNVYVGGSGIDNTGFALAAGEAISIGDIMRKGTDQTFDATQIYIDVDTNGEGVEFLYVEEV